MSKVDALRAMREAKYARAGAPPLPPGAVAPRAPKPVTRGQAGTQSRVAQPEVAQPEVARSEAAVPSADAETDALCGHRNMGGKSCSRPAGHSEKNHRYAVV